MIGERIRSRRKALGLTQSDIGGKIGVTKATLSLWENGATAPNGANLYALAKHLDCSPEWLLSGKSGPDSPAPEQPDTPVSLVKKEDLADWIAGTSKSAGSAGTKSALIRDAAGAGPRTFAYIENSDGMSPRIEPGDTVYIDPDQAECKPGREIWLFRVGNGYALGAVTETPRGLMLRFDNQAPGWEPMPVQPGDCAGKLVAFVPSWLN
ncbi:helix-turn-helix domain-containing protein [Oceanospirillaceae bacterium ASx5O]|nr:helix-turn-helix domain-containing protein [Oceanospirillaceae bacterium ASx5O]